MRNPTTRCNIYMLPSGRIVVRTQRYAISGGYKLACGVHPGYLPQIERLFVKGTANSRFVIEAISEAMMGRATLPARKRRTIARIYRERIADLRRGLPLPGATGGTVSLTRGQAVMA